MNRPSRAATGKSPTVAMISSPPLATGTTLLKSRTFSSTGQR